MSSALQALRAGVLATCLACLVSACAGPSSTAHAAPMSAERRMTSASGQAELLLTPTEHKVVGLVVFMHGIDANQDQLLTDGGLYPVRDALLAAGFAIMTTDGHGNNAGNPASVQDQLDALQDAEAALPPVADVNILAFSMGGLDALLVAAKHLFPRLRSLVLLSPATDQLAFLQGGFSNAITSAFSGEASPALSAYIRRWDPMYLPARDFRGYTYSFWHSRADQTVPYSQSVRMIAHLASAHVSASLSPLQGGHGDLSKLKSSVVVSQFELNA